jgi:hypothetical protein
MRRRSFAALAVASIVLSALLACTQDFASPEATLEKYITACEAGDKKTVLSCFHPPMSDFNLNEEFAVESYTITKKTTYEKSHVDEWNSIGIIPPAEIGDVDLEVKEILNGEPFMFSYLLREVDGEWKIISFSAWDVP